VTVSVRRPKEEGRAEPARAPSISATEYLFTFCSFDCRYAKQSGVTDCDALTCDYVLTYQVIDGDLAHFEMSATAGWVAVGFSSDDRMVRLARRSNRRSDQKSKKTNIFNNVNSAARN